MGDEEAMRVLALPVSEGRERENGWGGGRVREVEREKGERERERVGERVCLRERRGWGRGMEAGRQAERDRSSATQLMRGGETGRGGCRERPFIGDRANEGRGEVGARQRDTVDSTSNTCSILTRYKLRILRLEYLHIEWPIQARY